MAKFHKGEIKEKMFGAKAKSEISVSRNNNITRK